MPAEIPPENASAESTAAEGTASSSTEGTATAGAAASSAEIHAELTLFPIAGNFSGRLYVMRHPPGGSELPGAVATLRNRGVSTLVSFLTAEEDDTLALRDEGALFEEAGGTFIASPIADRGLPDDETSHDRLVIGLLAELTRGGDVVLHCWGGIGRSGLTASRILVATGVPADEAMARVSDARGAEAPETEAQCRFVRRPLPV